MVSLGWIEYSGVEVTLAYDKNSILFSRSDSCQTG